MFDLREFGQRLTRLRQRQGLTITRLAQRSEVDFMMIRRYELGENVPSLDRAARLAEALKVTLDELALGVEPPEQIRNHRLLDAMRALDQLPADRQEMALRVLDTIITGHELEELSARLKRR